MVLLTRGNRSGTNGKIGCYCGTTRFLTRIITYLIDDNRLHTQSEICFNCFGTNYNKKYKDSLNWLICNKIVIKIHSSNCRNKYKINDEWVKFRNGDYKTITKS